MHPQYPKPDIQHLIERLHTRHALRLEDLELSGPIELIPGVVMEAANAHTEGSMNIHVDTAEGLATICGDVIYDFQDQIIEPYHVIYSHEVQVTGNHAGSKRSEKAADQEAAQLVQVSAAGARQAGEGRARSGRRAARHGGARPDQPDRASARLVPGLIAPPRPAARRGKQS